MKKVIAKKVLIVILALSLLLFLYQLNFFFALFRDSVAITKIIESQDPVPLLEASIPSSLPPDKYIISLAKDLTPAENPSTAMGNFIPDPFDPYFRIKDSNSLNQFFQSVPNLNEIETELLKRISSAIASLPVVSSSPELLHLSYPRPNYRSTNETAKFWGALGRYQIERGAHEKAILTLMGPAMLAYFLEAEESKVTGVRAFTKLIGISCRNNSSSAIVHFAQALVISKADALKILETFEKLETSSANFGDTVKFESGILYSIGFFGRQAIENKTAEKVFGCDPTNSINILSDKTLLDNYLGPLLEPFLKGTKEPFQEGKKQIAVFSKALQSISLKLTNENFQWIGHFFNPKRFHLESLIRSAILDYGKVYSEEVESWAKLRGAAILLALQAFRLEKEEYPKSLDECSKWLEKSFPQDPFSNAPFVYRPDTRPQLLSSGPDGQLDTMDDLEFFAKLSK